MREWILLQHRRDQRGLEGGAEGEPLIGTVGDLGSSGVARHIHPEPGLVFPLEVGKASSDVRFGQGGATRASRERHQHRRCEQSAPSVGLPHATREKACHASTLGGSWAQLLGSIGTIGPPLTSFYEFCMSRPLRGLYDDQS